MQRREDHTDKVYGFIRCVEFSHINSNKETIWNCLCVCGKELKIQIYRLKSGNTKSCGCKRNELIQRSKRLEPGEASFNHLVRRIKRRAAQLGYEFNLTDDDIRVYSKQDCHYCGNSPNQKCKTQNYTGIYIYQGIDRIDSNIGYVKNNCVACCKHCNFAKNNLTTEQFLNKVKQIYKRWFNE